MHRKSRLYEAIAIAIASGAVGVSGNALAQGQGQGSKRLEEITVTATKRSENLQNVSIAVQVLDAQTLVNRNIQSFSDWAKEIPSLNFDGKGPGENRMFMRGITSGGSINSSGRAESTESVAFYVDNAAMTTTGRNIDIHLVDINRIEVLPGPQGTLYGQSSEAGTVRIITNQPQFNVWSGKVAAGVNTLQKGGTGYDVQGVLNIPVIEDRLALRAVAYRTEKAGYIDNVPGTISFNDNIYMPLLPLAPTAVIASRTNANLVKKDFNTAVYTGGRVTALLKINDDWELTVGAMAQHLDTEGVFDWSPNKGDLKISTYTPSNLHDHFVQGNWTLKGRLGMLDVVYDGAYIDQNIDQRLDYSYGVYDISFLPVYNCSYTLSPPQITGCMAPNPSVHFNEHKKRLQEELRFSTDPSKPLSAIGGIWYASDQKLALQEWQYSDPKLYARNLPISGSRTFYPPRPHATAFFNEILEKSDELAFFGELTYAFTDQLSATFGVRHSMINYKPWGSYNYATRGPVDTDSGGSLDGFARAHENPTVFKGTLTYRPTHNWLFYATYSQGFRRGGFNRQGAIYSVQTGKQVFPAHFKSDKLDNYELGWKLQLFNDRLRFNGAGFYMQWKDQQIPLYDPAHYGAVAFTANLAGSEVEGVETDFTALLTDNLTMSGGFTILGGKITKLPATGAEAVRPVGSALARVPTFKGNVNFRYDFRVRDIPSFVTFGVAHTGSMYDNLSATLAHKLTAYTLVEASLGVNFKQWEVRLLGSNLTDARPQLSYRDRGGPITIRSGPPRAVGVRVAYKF